ncbi:hypothetical protein [Nocardia transvalensis]|uniref:Mom family adenine methylcarbamoylation protein n=1 Tax=Nocardia transvalensis TaxID=37333 RepID=UPI0018939517|nr:hypothetical protein [Nocardia transvalensis]MBF6333485.1 hypothetical protein [Nocardia transvalensis]
MTECQRWRARRDSYRPSGEPFEPSRYFVAPIDYWQAATFIVAHHYSRVRPQICFAYGLFDRHHEDAYALVGVLTLGTGARAEALTGAFPDLVPYRQALELNRLVLLDEVPGNAESWFTARALRLAAAQGILGVIAFSDPAEIRQTLDDGSEALVKRGHIGIVYQALGMTYLGQGTGRPKLYLPNGTELSRRSLSKIAGRESGSGGVVARLLAHGAPPPPRPGADRTAWKTWLEQEALPACGVRRIPHPGNHKYALRIGPRTARDRVTLTGANRPYPKPESRLRA